MTPTPSQTPKTDAAQQASIHYRAKSLDIDMTSLAAIKDYLKNEPPDGWDFARAQELRIAELEKAANEAIEKLNRFVSKGFLASHDLTIAHLRQALDPKLTIDEAKALNHPKPE